MISKVSSIMVTQGIGLCGWNSLKWTVILISEYQTLTIGKHGTIGKSKNLFLGFNSDQTGIESNLAQLLIYNGPIVIKLT